MQVSDSNRPSMSSSAFIKLINSTVAFRSSSHNGEPYLALNNVNLHVAHGEFVAIVGRNGSGKSTLAQVIAGLLPVSAGQVTYETPDQPPFKKPATTSGASTERERAPAIQLVFQNPDAQIIGETVYEDVCFGLENYCCPAAEIEEKAMKALSQVGLESFRNAPVTALSGGQKSLLCIASALATEPEVLIFDEATAMLDATSRQHTLGIAQQLQKNGITVIWVTQWMAEVTSAKRVVALDFGCVRFDGTPRDFFYGCHKLHLSGQLQQPPPLDAVELAPCEELGLAAPYAVQIVQELLSQGVSLQTFPLTIEELVHEVGVLWT